MNENPTAAPVADREAWNQAHDRLMDYFRSFALGDHAQVSRLTLSILDQARQDHLSDPSRSPTTLSLELAQKRYTEWLGTQLQNPAPTDPPSFASGSMALVLSQVLQKAPETFLTGPLPDEMRRQMQQSLLVNSPELNISSMSPRPIDYGPMLDLAKQTWHRWNLQYLLVTLLFWIGVYSIIYYWLVDSL